MILSTPRLRIRSYCLVDPNGTWLFCLSPLRTLFEFPRANAYWVEVNTRQWPDKSGVRVQVRIRRAPEYAIVRDMWWSLYEATRPYLEQLGCTPGGPFKAIYVRLLYQEQENDMESDMDKIIEQLTAATAGAMTRWCANGMSTTGELVTRLRKADSCAHEFFANAFRPIIKRILIRPGDLEEIEGRNRRTRHARNAAQH